MPDLTELVQEVTIVRVQPGDVIVLTTRRRITPDMARELRSQVQSVWPNNKVVVADDVDISIARTDPDA
jgi:hypothetical protein